MNIYEKRIIGGIIKGVVRPSEIDLTTSDFETADLAACLAFAAQLESEGKTIDADLLCSRLSEKDYGFYTADDLRLMSAAVASASIVWESVDKVKSSALKTLILSETAKIALLEDKSSVELLDRIKAIVTKAEDHYRTSENNFVFLSELAPKVKAVYDDLHAGVSYSVPTYYPTIDNLILDGFSRGDEHIIVGFTGSGKALALDTRVPTKQGWTTMGEIVVGEQIFDEKGHLCSVINVTEVMADRECFRITFSDGTEIVADADHQWLANSARRDLVRRKDGWHDQQSLRSFPQVVTTRHISQTLTVQKDERPNHSIRVCDPIDPPNKSLLVDPYTLGVWLGDGKTMDGRIYGIDDGVFEEVRQAGYSVVKNKARCAYGVNGLKAQLRTLGVLGNKHIPSEYLRASFPQRLSLLQGLMDTDGSCAVGGGCSFEITHKGLAEDVLELVRSLGIKTTMRTGKATLNGRLIGPKYRIGFHTHLPVFRLKRKLDRQKTEGFRNTHNQRYILKVEPVPSVPVRCIEVDSPSHLFLVTDSFVPTHNSALALAFAREQARNGNCVGIVSREMSDIENVMRLQASDAQIPRWQMRKGMRNLTHSDLTNHLETFSDLPIAFDTRTTDVDALRPQVKRMVEGYDMKILYVDYLQLLASKGNQGTRAGEVQAISRTLKEIAMENKIPIVSLCQFNRGAAQATIYDILGHLKESSGIEQDASTILYVQLEKTEEKKEVKDAKLTVLKNRNGATFASVDLLYRGETFSFTEDAPDMSGVYRGGS